MRVGVLLAGGVWSERPPVRRMAQLDQMMQSLVPGFMHVKYYAYGCNCNMLAGDRPLSQPGAGQPIDELDGTCKSYKSCQQCVMDEHGDSCIGEFNDYSFDLLENGSQCLDTPGSCKRALCECDAQFSQAFSAKIGLYNQDFNHVFGMFQYETICRKYSIFERAVNFLAEF